MAAPRWTLPDHIEDALPEEAARIETLRRRLLDEFRLHGYQLVMPPLIEYIESLLSGTGKEMGEHTFRLTEPNTGRVLGLRADITPQVTRIDAHLLNRRGVTRLCYGASVVRTQARSLLASRQALQLGAEVFGHAGPEADIEVIRLLARCLSIAGVKTMRIDLGHVGLFRALAQAAGLVGDAERELFTVLQAKDVPALQALLGTAAEPARRGLLALPALYGGAEVLERAAQCLPTELPAVGQALEELRSIVRALPDLPLSFDLADLRGYDYHSGLVFAAFCGAHPAAVAFGGRYDEVGKAFGRARPATGFSVNDLRDLVVLGESSSLPGAILAPLAGEGLDLALAQLRAAGEHVLSELPGHAGTWREAGCDRQLIWRGDRWVVEALCGD